MKYKIDFLGVCPHCGSENVGYVLYGIDDINVHNSYRRRKGCHVRFKDPSEYDRNGFNPNRFCFDCDVEWISNDKPEPVIFDDVNEYQEAIKDRGLHTSQIRKTKVKKNRFLKLINKVKQYSINPFN